MSDHPPDLPETGWLKAGFTWRDGERLIRFGSGTAGEAHELLAAVGLTPFVLLSTERAQNDVPALAAAATNVLHVPPGPVPEAAATIRAQLERPSRDRREAVVALGGGRVIDVAKAIAAADGCHCAALPTTLSGAEMSRAHRPLPGYEALPPVRPNVVVNDPALSASQPLPGLAASAMNALGHAFEALYAPGANPVAEAAALRAAALLTAGLGGRSPRRDALALGGLLAGFAIGATGMSLHHLVCQTIVRLTGTPHAATNAVILPHSVRFMSARLPAAGARFAHALSEGLVAAAADETFIVTAAVSGPPEGQKSVGDLVASLAGKAGVTQLRQLGVTSGQLPEIAAAAGNRLHGLAGGRPVGQAEIEALLEDAF